MSDKPRLLVDFVADPVCPWCHVGLRALRAALGALGAEFAVLPRLRAYQLNPDTPEGGVERKAYLERKFPDAGFRAAARESLIAAARETGFEFDPGLPERLPNTLKAQALLRRAHYEGAQMRLAAILYDAYWGEGRDIGEESVLAEIADAAGLGAGAFAAALAEIDAARGEAEAMRAAGVAGVPTFIVNERAGFSGALAPPALIEALRRAIAA